MAGEGFNISGADDAGRVPVSPGQMPQYIQFRLNGVNVGGPDATVVDFVGAGWVVTRVGNTVLVSLG